MYSIVVRPKSGLRDNLEFFLDQDTITLDEQHSVRISGVIIRDKGIVNSVGVYDKSNAPVHCIVLLGCPSPNMANKYPHISYAGYSRFIVNELSLGNRALGFPLTLKVEFADKTEGTVFEIAREESAEQRPAGQETPLNCALMMGLPRSGTTIVTRVIARHSKVKAVVEPYHSRRHERYETVDFSQFLSDLGGTDERESLFLKETTTFSTNVSLSLALLKSAVLQGVRPLAFLVLRSPVEAYLSQVDAAKNLYKSNPDFDYGEQWIDMFVESSLRGLHQFLIQAERYHHRVVLYRRFVGDPRNETRRLLAAFPHYFEPSQIELGPTKVLAGDPGAWKSEKIAPEATTKRAGDVEKFASDFAHHKGARSLIALDHAIKEWSENTEIDDDQIWAESERLIRMELVRNGLRFF